MIKSQIVRASFGVTALLLLWGCGNPFTRKDFYPQGTSSRAYSTTYTTPESQIPGYTCPSSPNVKNVRNGDPAISACTSATNSADVALVVQAPLQSICVFPAQYVDATHVYWKIDPTSGGPMVKCGALPGMTSFYDPVTPAIFSFPSTNYNAVYIVDEVDRDDMNLCMVLGQSYCPMDYYYGKFR